MAIPTISIAAETPLQPAVAHLLALSDEFAFSLYPADSCYLLDARELDVPGVTVFVARCDGEPLGMAALVIDEGGAELKRLFVEEKGRGNGVAKALVAAVEAQARASGFSVLRLETGPLQPIASGLYRGLGYRVIPNFGQYVGDEFSVCMEKSL